MKTNIPLIDTWNWVKEISSIDAQTARTLNKMKQCYVCEEKAIHGVYYKAPNKFMGSFIGLCDKHTRKDI